MKRPCKTTFNAVPLKKKTMKTLLTFLFPALLSVSTAVAQMELGPKFDAKEMEVDFNSVKTGGKHDAVFVYKNAGNQPLLITQAEGSCGCTVPDYPKGPLKPGGTGQIKITYDAKAKGPFNKTVTLTTNEVEGKNSDGQTIYKKHVIQVSGNVVD